MATDVEIKTLSIELPKEMARVGREVMPAYQEIGVSGAFALTWMQAALDKATKATAEGDVVAMMQAYEELKGASV